MAGRCATARPANSPKARLRQIHTRPILGGADGPNDVWIVGTYELQVSPTDEANSPTDAWAVGCDTVPGTFNPFAVRNDLGRSLTSGPIEK